MKTYCGVIIPILIASAGVLRGGQGQTQEKSTVVAEINGTTVTLGELEQKRADNLFQPRHTYYNAERKALDDLIDERLLELQASRENVTVDQLLERHVYSQIKKDPTDEQMEIFYESLQTDQSFDTVRGTMLSKLRELRITKARAAYIKTLRSDAKISVSLPEPRVEFVLDDHTPVRGSRNAPVMIVEFADYQCPYCRQLEPELGRLQSEFKDKVAVAFMDWPLPMHAYADKLAEAARCAGEQGKYWEMHDFMFHDFTFKEAKTVDITQIREHASALNLDSARFNTCVDSDAEAKAIKRDATEAQHLALTGTPAVFVNGRFLSGSAKYETLRDVVQQELSAASSHPQQTAQR